MKQSDLVSPTVNLTTALDDGTPVSLNEGRGYWRADDPFVKAHPDWFGEIDESKLQSSGPNVAKPQAPKVERATRAPGEKRGPGRPRSDGN